MASVSFTTLVEGIVRYSNPIMFQVEFSSQEGPKHQARSHDRRVCLVVMTLVLTILSASCASLVKSRDNTIPKLLTPLADAKFEDLTKQIQQFTSLQALRSSLVYIKF